VPSALDRLLGDEAAGFLAHHWGRSPVHVRTVADAALLRLDDVDRLVASSGLRAPAFRLVRQGRTLPVASVTRRARIGSRPVTDLIDVEAVHREVGAGATLVLQGLHRSWGPVAALCRELEGQLSHPVQANAYLTPPVAQGLRLHADPHDVFAVQTWGSKRWVVHPPGEDEPWDLTLEPGDVLYLPTGTRHAAQTVGSASLHLTIGVRAVTWRQVLERLITDALADDPALGTPLPAGWADAPASLEAELGRHVEAFAGRLHAAPGALGAAAERFHAGRQVDRTGGLRDVLEVDRLTDTTVLRRRELDGALRLARVDGHLEVRFGGGGLRFPAATEPVLRHILEVDRFAPGDLDELIDGPSRAVLCRQLLRAGVLTFDRDGEGARSDAGLAGA
jgi:bifunctional lysine-specific demethylase and histidyl-hydroxylase NO66